MTEVEGHRAGEEKVPLGFGSTGSGRLVYAKPFVAAPKAIVGGYMDIQYRSQRKASIENGYEEIRTDSINSGSSHSSMPTLPSM